jgi:hypothetical protein
VQPLFATLINVCDLLGERRGGLRGFIAIFNHDGTSKNKKKKVSSFKKKSEQAYVSEKQGHKNHFGKEVFF